MQINTCLWGGKYNPIIPIFKVTPKEWQSDRLEYLKGYEIAKGYVRFFEPDVYVEAEEGLLEKAGLAALRSETSLNSAVVGLNEFMAKEYQGFNYPYFGQSIYDVLKHTYESERRFTLKNERPAIIASSKNDFFAHACIGVYPEGNGTKYLSDAFRNVFSPEEVDSCPETWLKLHSKSPIFPLGITFNHIERVRYSHHEPIIYLFDPNSSLDLIDLWNIRIEPSPVFPVPIKWFDDLSDFLKNLISQNYRPLKDNPHGIMHSLTVEIARSVTEKRAREVILPAFDELPQGSWRFKPWRNSIWHPPVDVLHKPQYERMKVSVSERQVHLTLKNNGQMHSQFETLSPFFAQRYSGSSFRWANVIVPKSYSDSEIVTVLPYNTFDRSWPSLGLGGENVCITQEGWVFTQDYKDWHQPLYFLKNDQAFTQWFKKLGISATLSEPGRIAKQILHSLDGFWRLHLVNDPQIVKFINKLAMRTRRHGGVDDSLIHEENFTGRTASIQEWQNQIRKHNSNHVSKFNISDYTKCNAIRLGLQTDCSHCGAKNWHDLNEVAYEVRCERCLKYYDFPQADLKKQNGNWMYRVVGPFAVPDYAQGAYCSLLTINALSKLSSPGLISSTNYSTALDLISSDKKCEIDFALWSSEVSSHDYCSNPKLVIGEAKSFGENIIKEKDISQLKIAAEMLPDSVITISVLKENFSSNEKALLRKFIDWARRPVNHEPRHWVILLTGTELFAENGISNTWKNKGGPFSKFSHYNGTRTLRDLSNSTQAIYLKMPNYYTWLRKKRNFRH
ncbi:MAG: hypothetical protein NPIRA02_32300 [Nitrospirales bacterium]|nr:MAG: hypothetical protein NPIRA02_32300 [Nitrospirales bacterium]